MNVIRRHTIFWIMCKNSTSGFGCIHTEREQMERRLLSFVMEECMAWVGRVEVHQMD